MNGASLADQLATGVDVAGAGARLDERGALPVLAEALVVDQRRLGRQRDLRGAGVGAQSQVGAEHVAVAGALGHHLHEIARQAHEEALRLDVRRGSQAVAVVKDDEVDVAGVVELAGAILAHGEHDDSRQASRGRPPPRIHWPRATASRNRKSTRALSAASAHSVRARRHLQRRPDTGQIGQRRQQGDLGLEHAQRAHCVGARCRGAETALKFASSARRADVSGAVVRMRWIRCGSRSIRPER